MRATLNTFDVAYRWTKSVGSSAQRVTPKIYTPEEKVEFFRLMVEQSHFSAA
jgi:hypothetical protein